MTSASTSETTTPPNVTSSIIGFVIFTFIGYFTIGLNLGVLPIFIHHDLGYSAVVAGVVISLQYLTTFIFRGYAGKIVDDKGPKPAVLMGMAGFALSGIFLAIAYALRAHTLLSLSGLVITRLMTGFSEGMIGTSPINWAVLAVGDKNTGKAISYNGIGSYGALAAGAPVGIFLNGAWGMYSLAVLSIILALAGLIYARNKIALKGNSTAPKEAFLKVLRLVLPYGICLTMGGLGFGTISTFITLYYAYFKWKNAVLCLSVFSTLFIIGRVLFANAIDNYGGTRTSIFCLALESIGLLVISVAPSPSVALIGAGVAGLGFSLVFPALGVDAVRAVPGSNKGAALGGYGLFLDASLGLTGPLVGGVASHFGMGHIFIFSFVMVLLGCVLAIYIYNNQRFIDTEAEVEVSEL